LFRKNHVGKKYSEEVMFLKDVFVSVFYAANQKPIRFHSANQKQAVCPKETATFHSLLDFQDPKTSSSLSPIFFFLRLKIVNCVKADQILSSIEDD